MKISNLTKRRFTMDKIMEIIEQIWAIDLVRFIVYLLIAFIAAGIAKLLVVGLLKLIKVDKLFDKWGINDGPVGTSMTFVGRLVYLIVFLCFVPSALSAIGINSVAEAVSSFVYAFIGYIPNIIAAVVLVYIGVLVAKVLGQIVSALLKKTKLEPPAIAVVKMWQVPLILVVTIAFFYFVLYVGTVVGIFLFMFGMIWLFDEDPKKNWKMNLIVAVCATVGLWLIFTKVLPVVTMKQILF